MPHNNNAFQPKNARTIHTFDEGDDDDDLDDTSLFGSSMSTSTKKTTSGTQALADFLNTTSPEEFQRPTPSSTISTSSSSSSNFFRLRKNKRTPQQAKSSSSTTTLSSTLSTTPSPTPTTTLSTLGDVPIIQQQQQRNNNSNNKHIKITPSLSSSHKQQQEQRSLSLAPKSPTLSLSSSHQSSLAIRSNEPQSPILPNRRRESSLYSGSLRNNASLRGKMSDYGSSGRNHHNNNNNNHQRRNIMELFEQPPPLVPPPPPASSSSPSHSNNNIEPAKEIDQIDVALLQRLEQFNNGNAVSSSLDQSILPKTATTTTAEKARTTKARRHIQTQTIETCITDPTSSLIDHQKDNNYNNRSSYNNYGRQQQAPGITVEQLEKQIADEKRRQKRLQAAMQESTDQFEVLSGLAYMKLRELWEEKMRWEEAYFTLNERLDEIDQQQETSLSSQGVSVPVPIAPGASLLHHHQVISPSPAQSI